MMQSMYSHSYLFGAPFIEELYEQYLADANSVPAEWRDYFDKLAQAPGAAERDVPHMPIQESFIQLAKKPASGPRNTTGGEWETMQKQVGVLKLISAYRVLGSRQASTRSSVWTRLRKSWIRTSTA
jgi:2-oxoglutarate dehydrogenase E1 component